MLKWLENWLESFIKKMEGINAKLDAYTKRINGTRNSKTVDELLKEPTRIESWTEQELVEWVNSLPDDHRDKIIEKARRVKALGGNPLQTIATIRRDYPEPTLWDGLELFSDVFWGITLGNVAADYWAGKFTK